MAALQQWQHSQQWQHFKRIQAGHTIDLPRVDPPVGVQLLTQGLAHTGSRLQARWDTHGSLWGREGGRGGGRRVRSGLGHSQQPTARDLTTHATVHHSSQSSLGSWHLQGHASVRVNPVLALHVKNLQWHAVHTTHTSPWTGLPVWYGRSGLSWAAQTSQFLKAVLLQVLVNQPHVTCAALMHMPGQGRVEGVRCV